MKVTGINTAKMAGVLAEYASSTTQGSKDSGSVESLLSSNLSANNTVMAKLSGKLDNKADYQKALKAIDQSNELLNALSDGKKSVFIKAKDETLTEEEQESLRTTAAGDVAEWVSSYNVTVKSLTEAGGKTNKGFLQELEQITGAYADRLQEIGLTPQADGTLTLDAEKLAAADRDTLEALFGADASFAKELSEKTYEIADDTASTVDMLQIYSSAYSNSGSYSQYKYMKAIYELEA